jgi:hypothetical protein
MVLAPNLSITMDGVTESFAVLGRRGSGKTHSASVLAEEMLKTGQQVVIIDPLDVWWGLRSSANGKISGYPVVVFGGQRADLPLSSESGTVLADAIIDTGISAIVSLRHLSKAAARRFAGEFCERLYERKGEDAHRKPLHLIVDEADCFIPQRPMPDGMRAYGAIDTIVRRGRSSGFGTTLISQRAAVIAKDVLTQTEVLICHQTTGPQDRKALEAWVDQNDDDGHKAEFLGSLASLRKGEAWFWSPGLLKVFKRVQVRERYTFDSSSTPKVGAQPVAPKTLVAVDLDRLRELLKTLGKSKPENQNDSAELKKLRAENVRLVEENSALNVTCFELTSTLDKVAEALKTFKLPGPDVKKALTAKTTEYQSAPKPSHSPGPEEFERVPVNQPTAGISRCARLILVALLENGKMTLGQAAVCAGYSSDSGGVRNAAGELRAAGYVEGTNTGGLTATKSGRSAGGNVAPIPSGKRFLEYWLARLSKAERELLQVAVSAHPKAVSLKVAAEKCGYEPTSGGVRNAAGKLRSLNLVSGGNAAMTANERLV